MKAGYRIAQERNSQGMSQEDLAGRVRRLGGKITQTGIDKIEKRDSARPRYVKEIALSLGVSEDWIIHNRQPKARSIEPELQAMLHEVISFETTDQIMIMAALRAQIEIVRKRGAKLSTVQAFEAELAKSQK